MKISQQTGWKENFSELSKVEDSGTCYGYEEDSKGTMVYEQQQQ